MLYWGMARQPTTTQWMRQTDDSLDEPCSSQALVDAFNARDLQGVARGLEENPDGLHQTAFLWAKKTKGSYPPSMSAAEAAVHMGWARVLPVLHAGGDRFDKPRDIGALHMATHKQKTACVGALLKLGASIGCNENGLAPIAMLKARWVMFDKNTTMRKIGKAYIKAGQDPWQDTGRGPAVCRMLKNSAIGVAIDLLEHQRLLGTAPGAPSGVDGFWDAMIVGIEPLFGHFSARPIISHIEPLCSLVEAAGRAGIQADRAAMSVFLKSTSDKMQDASLSRLHHTHIMTGIARVGVAMAHTMPDPLEGICHLLELVEPHEAWIDPGLIAACRSQVMDARTQASGAGAPSSLRF